MDEEEDSKGPKVPCVVCFVPVPGDIADKFILFEPLTQEEKECDKLFQWFLLNFRYEILQRYRRKGRRRQVKSWMDRFDQIINKDTSIGWDGQGGKSLPLPFCGECRAEVTGFMDRKNGLPNLRKGTRTDEENNLKQGILEMRRKMQKCEAEFLQSGIYDKDKRYLRVRNDIFKLHWYTTVKARKKEAALQQMVKEEVAEELPQPQEETVVEVPCLICCTTLTIFPNEKKTDARKAEDLKVFRWFLNNFKNPLGQMLFRTNTKGLKEKGTGELWDGQRGISEPLQFCGGCREEIMEFIEGLRNEAMRRRKVTWIRLTKMKMKECEDEFGRCGIYERDWRYFNVRRKVIKVLDTDLVQDNPLHQQPPPQKKKLFEKREMDRILGRGFGKGRGQAQQLVKFVVRGGDDEESEQDWQWEEDEEPPIIQNKLEMDFDEEDGGMEDPLGPGTSAFGGADQIMRVKEERYWEEDEDTDLLEPHTGHGHSLDDENDNLDDNHHPYRNCLLCYKAISKKKIALVPVLTNDLNEQNFNSVFILRKMLNVPKGSLGGYLKEFGCPGKWVEYCNNCLGLVDKSLRLQKEISELEDKLRMCQEKMLLKIKTTSRRKKKNGSEESCNITRITEETRQFVSGRQSQGNKSADNLNRSTTRVPSVTDICRDKRTEDIGRKLLRTLKEQGYTCSLCPNLNLTKPMSFLKFYRHLIFHALRPFKCSTCNIYWSSPKELEKNPFVTENPSTEHVCSEATLVKIPDGKFNPGKIWTCEWCPIKFDIETERDSHEEEQHSSLKNELNMEYPCLSCPSAHRSFREWLLHRVLEHPKIAAVSCLFCSFTAATPTKEGIDILNSVEMKQHVSSKHPACEHLLSQVVSQDDNDDNRPLESPASDEDADNEDDVTGPLESASPPPSPPDDLDFDPSYQDSDSNSEQVDLKPSSAKKLKLSRKDEEKKVTPKRKVCTGETFLENFKDKNYTCSVCPNLKKPMSLDKFYRHLIFHSQRPFKCSVCNVYWSGVSELEKNPFLKENPSSEHVCSEATLVKIPNGKFYLGEIWSCKWCHIKFGMETERDSHEDLVHGSFKDQLEMEYNCLSCSKGYRSYTEWLFHRVLEHPKVASISCLFCDFTAAIQTKEGIDILDWLEVKRHTGLEHPACKDIFVSLYTCDFCGIPVRCKSTSLESHIKVGHKFTSGRCMFSCSCCHYRTDRLSSLKMHINLRHALEPPSFTAGREGFDACDVCGKEGMRGVQLMDHKMVQHGLEPEEMEEYTGEEILKCKRGKECGGFRTLIKRNLRVHMSNRHGAKAKRKWISGSKSKGRELYESEADDEFICSLCPTLQQPMSLGKFHKHLIFHTKRPYRCSICNVHWSSAKELEKNPFLHENPPTEHVCSEATLVKIPEGKFNPGKIWSCEWCPADNKFDNERERDLHEDQEHSSLKAKLTMKYKCLTCSTDDGGGSGKKEKGYRSHEEWLLHRVLEHPEVAGISCLFCDFTSVIKTKEGIEILNWMEMGKHVNLEHAAKKQLFFAYHDCCDFCGNSFRNGGPYLAQHIKDEHKLTSGNCPHSCPCCHLRYDNLRTLRHHLNKSHSHDPRPPSRRPGYTGRNTKLICDICGNSLMSRLQLCDHKMVRHGVELEGMEGYKGEKVLSCERGEECGGFRCLLEFNMRDHMMRKHGAERRWKCDQCGKGFTDGNKLTVHKQIHTGLRPYQCEICGNSFAVRNYLYIHKRLSHQNRPFASTNRKRPSKRAPSRMGNVPPPPQVAFPPPTQLATAPESTMQSFNFRYNEANNAMDSSSMESV